MNDGCYRDHSSCDQTGLPLNEGAILGYILKDLKCKLNDVSSCIEDDPESSAFLECHHQLLKAANHISKKTPVYPELFAFSIMPFVLSIGPPTNPNPTETVTVTDIPQPTDINTPPSADVSATNLPSPTTISKSGTPLSQLDDEPSSEFSTPSSTPASLSSEGNGSAKDIAISIAVALVIIFLFILGLYYYRRRRRDLKHRQTDRLYADYTIQRGGLVSEPNALDNNDSLGFTSTQMRQSFHPDIVAPMYPIRTLPPESRSADGSLVTGESQSTVLPPSSSCVPLPSTLAGKHELEIETRRSTLVGDLKPNSQSYMPNGTQENVEMLQRQLEMMREQMDIIHERITILSKAPSSN